MRALLSGGRGRKLRTEDGISHRQQAVGNRGNNCPKSAFADSLVDFLCRTLRRSARTTLFSHLPPGPNALRCPGNRTKAIQGVREGGLRAFVAAASSALVRGEALRDQRLTVS